MNKGKRTLAAVTAISVLATGLTVTSCGKKKDEYVSDDAPWYSVTKLETCTQYQEADDINFVVNSFAGMSNDMFYYVSSGMYNVPEGADYATVDYTELMFLYLDIYDMNGDLYKTIDLNNDIDISSVIPDGESAPNGYTVMDSNNIRIEDGDLIFLIDVMLFPSWEDHYYYVTYDIESEAVKDMELSLVGDSSNVQNSVVLICYPSGSYKFDGYLVDTFTTHTVDHPPIIKVETPEGNISQYDIEDVLPDLQTPDISEVIYQGNGQALIGFYAGNFIDKSYYTLDLQTGEFTPYAEDTSWFSNYFTYCEATYIEGTGYVITDNTGIKKINFENKEIEEIFSYDYCNINRYDTKNLSIVSIDDNRIILSGAVSVVDSAGYEVMSQRIFILDRQESNPHAGKKIITAATLTDFDYTFCEAVVNYNESSTDHYIVLDGQYSMLEMYLEGEIRSYSDGFATDGLETQSQVSDKLAIDLMSGDGPDIILDGASFYQLYNDEYLMDLSSDVDTSSIFANIVDSAKVDGKLYQLPLTIGINGIVADKNDIASGQCGFTFEQYASFVSGTCNGEDPIDMGKTEFFLTCLASLNEECISGDIVDYGTDSFRALASYVNDNVFDPVTTAEDDIVDYYEFIGTEDFNGGAYVRDISFASFIRDYYTEDIEELTILGIPSADGSGPMITVSSSIAISSKTGDKDACLDFVKSLLSDDVQRNYGILTGSIPVNINAFETSSSEILSEINEEIELNLAYAEVYGFTDPTMPSSVIDSSVIDNFENIINSCSQVASLDPEIMVIVKEEIPAYFAGQKTIDEVISILNDRVTTFMNERG